MTTNEAQKDIVFRQREISERSSRSRLSKSRSRYTLSPPSLSDIQGHPKAKRPLSKHYASYFKFQLSESDNAMMDSSVISSDDQDYCLENDFASCFIDESDSDEEYLKVEELELDDDDATTFHMDLDSNPNATILSEEISIDNLSIPKINSKSINKPSYTNSSEQSEQNDTNISLDFIPKSGSRRSPRLKNDIWKNKMDIYRNKGDIDQNIDLDKIEVLDQQTKIFVNNYDNNSGHGDADIDIDFVDMALARDTDNPPILVPDIMDHALSRGELPEYGTIRKEAERLIIPTTSRSISQVSRKNTRRTSRKKFEPNVSFGYFDMFIGIFAIVLFFIDIGTDIELAIQYRQSDDQEYKDYGIVTAVLIVVPSLVTCFLGLHWYIIDYRKEKEVIKKLEQAKKKTHTTPTHLWILRIIFTVLQMGPVIR